MILTVAPAWADNLDISEDYMAERIPSNILIARAVPTRAGKFHALYSAPGLYPAVACDRDGRAYEYLTEEEAERGAMRTLINVFNTPRSRATKDKPERYQKMTGPEFAVALQNAGITPTFFAFIYGTSQKRVLAWIDGVENVPHPARLLLALFIADQRNIDVAENATEAVTTERKPRRND